MTVKSRKSRPASVDPDDAPEITDGMLARGEWKVGERPVSAQAGRAALRKALRGRPKLDAPKRALTVRYDAAVVEAFRATGKGWQTRMNAALLDWLKSHSPG